MKKERMLLCFLSMFFILAFASINVSDISANYSSNQVVDRKVTVNGVSVISKQYKVGNDYRYKIIISKNGKAIEAIKNTRAEFTTDGKILYYLKRGKSVNTWQHRYIIYRYSISTQKEKRLLSGIEYTVMGCSGRYLYYGRDNEADGVDVYALDTKNGKKKRMIDGVGQLYVSGGRAITEMNTGAVGNVPIHSFCLNGSREKKIVDGILLKAQKGKITYAKVSEKTWKYKIYECTVDGEERNALTGWLDRIPDSYYK